MHIPFDRIVLAKEICDAAKVYEEELVGKTLMYVFDNRYIEVTYRKRDFSHLTGVKTSLSALDFFKEAKRGTLRYNQFSFKKDHNYKMCSEKVYHLRNIHLIKDSELFMHEEITTDSHIFKFGVTELNFCLCFGENKDKEGKVINECYIPMSLRIGDNFKKAKAVLSVDYIFMKNNDEKIYSEITYKDDNKNLEELSAEIKEKLSDKILSVWTI